MTKIQGRTQPHVWDKQNAYLTFLHPSNSTDNTVDCPKYTVSIVKHLKDIKNSRIFERLLNTYSFIFLFSEKRMKTNRNSQKVYCTSGTGSHRSSQGHSAHLKVTQYIRSHLVLNMEPSSQQNISCLHLVATDMGSWETPRF